MHRSRASIYFYYSLCVLLFLTACAQNPHKNDDVTGTAKNSKGYVNATTLCADSISYTGTTDPHFLIVSDVHLDTSAQAIVPGEDTGMDLWRKTTAKIDSLLRYSPSKPDFMLYLGDLPVHTDPGELKWAGISHVLDGLEALSEKADVPLLYLPGNNDGLGVDYTAFSNGPDQPPPYSITSNPPDWPMIEEAGPCVTHGTQACMIDDSHRDMGYYSAYPTADHKLRVIAMNTVQFCVISRHHTYTPLDSQGVQAPRQLTWLNEQLADSRNIPGEKVLIAMHIPPGNSAYCKGPGDPDIGLMWRDDLTDSRGNPYNLLDTFLNIIHEDNQIDASHLIGIFTSHTHMDEIRILNDPSGNPMKVAVSTPGVTVNHKNNPGMKIVHYNPSADYRIEDFTTLYTRLNTPHWGDRAYTFSDAYNCSGNDLYGCLVTKIANGHMGDIYTSMTSVLSVCNFDIVCDIEPSLVVDY